MANEIEGAFGKMLESHRDVPAETSMASIRDPSFAVLRLREDLPFFDQLRSVLCSTPESHKKKKVQRRFASVMKSFLAAESDAPAARRAIVTASLNLLRHSCAVTVPAKLSSTAAYAVIRALAATAPASAATAAAAGAAAAATAAGGRKKHHRQQHVAEAGAAAAGTRTKLVLGTEGFPESQVAAFLLDATRIEPPPPPTPPIAVPADVAVKIISVLGVGGKGSSDDCLEWGSPSVSDCIRGSVRRVANRLQRERKWDLVLELVEHMETSKGIAECEGVLGLRLGELIASAMLQEEWEPARRLVSVAAAGPPRQTLARELIPAATEAGVFEVATRLIEDHNLVSEFPNYNELLDKVWLEDKKRRLKAAVTKPGWKMAQQMLDRGSRHKRDLAIWLVGYMIELRNLPAAASLMDYWDLHGDVPPLDPLLVEASARERAAAHLQLPISMSRVVLVDGAHALQYAQHALTDPPLVGGRGGLPGVSCVGLDVENCPVTSTAVLLQVATTTDVFLFDLIALSERRAEPDVFRRFDATMDSLLSNPRIVKLGFSFSADATALRKACPSMRGFRRILALLEVGDLSYSVLGRKTPSLSKTCEAWLGKPLDKTECASKWATRPLSLDQVKYAALDSHCLVGIFEEMLIERGARAAAGGVGGGGGGGGDGVGREGGNPHAWWTKFLGSSCNGQSSKGRW
eukprot:g3990.t1